MFADWGVSGACCSIKACKQFDFEEIRHSVAPLREADVVACFQEYTRCEIGDCEGLSWIEAQQSGRPMWWLASRSIQGGALMCEMGRFVDMSWRRGGVPLLREADVVASRSIQGGWV